MGVSAAGKGDDPRPMAVTKEQFYDNFESTFGKKEFVQWVPPPLPDWYLEEKKERERSRS